MINSQNFSEQLSDDGSDSIISDNEKEKNESVFQYFVTGLTLDNYICKTCKEVLTQNTYILFVKLFFLLNLNKYLRTAKPHKDLMLIYESTCIASIIEKIYYTRRN